MLPNISLQQTLLTPFGSKLTVGAGIQTAISGLSTFNYLTTPQISLSYQQPLSAAGVESGHADNISAKRSYLNSELAFQLGKDQFVLSVIEGYFQLWQSLKQVVQSERDLNSTKRVLEIADIELNSGSILRFEVLNLRVQNRLSQDNMVQAKNNLETQTIAFYQLIGDTADMWHPDTALRLASDFPQHLIADVKMGQEVEYSSDVFSGKFFGKVIELPVIADQQSTQQSGMAATEPQFTVTATISGFRNTPLIGSSVEGAFILAVKEKTLFIPEDAVMFRSDRPVVFISSSGHALARVVKLGLTNRNSVEIRSGLTKADTVVTSGNIDLSDGDRITSIDNEKNIYPPKYRSGPLFIPQ